MKLEGADSFIDKLNATPGRVSGNIDGALRRIGFDLQGKAQRSAPVDTGDLRGSAFSRVNRSRFGPSLEVGFEGLPYIIPQHEGGWQNFMGRYGPKRIMNHPHGGGPKFLERPWLENKAQYLASVGDAARRGLRG